MLLTGKNLLQKITDFITCKVVQQILQKEDIDNAVVRYSKTYLLFYVF